MNLRAQKLYEFETPKKYKHKTPRKNEPKVQKRCEPKSENFYEHNAPKNMNRRAHFFWGGLRPCKKI